MAIVSNYGSNYKLIAKNGHEQIIVIVFKSVADSDEQRTDIYTDFYRDFDAGRAVNMLSSLGIDERMPLRKMSKGTREKVQLIMTMSRRAKVYLLDEPC